MIPKAKKIFSIITKLLLLFTASSICFKYSKKINFKTMQDSKMVYVTKSHFYKGGHIHISTHIDTPKASSSSSIGFNIMLFHQKDYKAIRGEMPCEERINLAVYHRRGTLHLNGGIWK